MASPKTLGTDRRVLHNLLAVRWRTRARISNASIFEAAVTRETAGNRLIDKLLALLGTRPATARLIETGKLTIEDIEEARSELKKAVKNFRTFGNRLSLPRQRGSSDGH